MKPTKPLTLMILTAALVSAASMGVGGALAQEQGGGDEGILAGPKVQDDTLASGRSQFGAPMRGDAIEVPANRWFVLASRLSGLSEEQIQKMRVIQREFQGSGLAFRNEHAEELRALERKRRAAREAGPPLEPADVVRYREILELTPKPADAQQAIWDLLNETQQDELRATLEAERKQMRARRQNPRDRVMTDEMTDSAVGQDVMTQDSSSGDDTMMQTGGEMQESARAGQGGVRSGDRDSRASRRLRFLRSRQLYRPRGTEPAPADREFRFEDGSTGRSGDSN